MAKAKPQAEQAYTYTAEQPLGVDAGALTPGTKIQVREVVPADEPGAHDGSEESVVVEWDAPALVQTENGVEVGTAPRAMSVGLAQFHDLFTKEG